MPTQERSEVCSSRGLIGPGDAWPQKRRWPPTFADILPESWPGATVHDMSVEKELSALREEVAELRDENVRLQERNDELEATCATLRASLAETERIVREDQDPKVIRRLKVVKEEPTDQD